MRLWRKTRKEKNKERGLKDGGKGEGKLRGIVQTSKGKIGSPGFGTTVEHLRTPHVDLTNKRK